MPPYLSGYTLDPASERSLMELPVGGMLFVEVRLPRKVPYLLVVHKCHADSQPGAELWAQAANVSSIGGTNLFFAALDHVMREGCPAPLIPVTRGLLVEQDRTTEMEIRG